MALLAEELVEEWLNRQGYFTIRGLRCGIHEMDLLAVGADAGGGFTCRHIEVQASVRPVSYLTPLSREVQRREGLGAGSARFRTDDVLRAGVAEWLEKKFDNPRKRAIRERLMPGGRWSRELVVHELKFARERELLEAAGVTVLTLRSILRDLRDRSNGCDLDGAAGCHLADLVSLTLDPPAAP